MASTKRDLPFYDEPQLKKARVVESEPSQSKVRVVLNPADCDIDFNVERDGLVGSALYQEGFAYCWSGARANTGITRGKYCFGCKIASLQAVDMEDTPVDLQHVCRVGISRGDDAVRDLGETLNSYGFGSTGKFSNSRIFFDYGEKFGVGDTIVCAVDLESRPMASIGFSKNGKWLGVAKHFDAGPSGLGLVGSPIKNLQWESAIFPHVLLKNVIVQLQFSIDDGLIPEGGYKPWADAILDGNTIPGPAFSDQNECEVIMMVGLPACGKTTWAEKWMNEHPEKRYVLLGTNLALEQMKVPGLLRKHNYGERFDRLMDRATKIFNVLLSRASRKPRNFIIDQTNVYKSARKRKLKPFADYIKIAVVVFPKEEELKSRAEKRFKEMGKEVPADAVNEMLANYTLPMRKDMPRADEYFDQVWFVELSRAEAKRSLDEMKREISVKPHMLPCSRESSLMSCSSSSLQHRQKSPIPSYTGVSFQNQGVGDHHQHSYSYRPASGALSGSYHSGPSIYSPGCDFDYIGSCGGNAWPNGPSRLNTAEPYPRTSSLPYNTSDNRYANASGGAACDLPSIVQSATPSPYGSYRTQISRPPYGSFPNDVQHTGVYPQPSPLRPLSVNLPMDVHSPYGIPNHAWNVGVSPQHSPMRPSSANLPMNVHAHGNFPNYVQNVGMSPQPSSLRPPPPLAMDVRHPGVYPRPPQGY